MISPIGLILLRILYMNQKNNNITSLQEMSSWIGRSMLETERLIRNLYKRRYLVINNKGERALTVELTPKGRAKILQFLAGTQQEFGLVPEIVTISGKVFSGKGEGRFFMGIEGYRRQFESKLGFTPFQGTLNLLLEDERYVNWSILLEELPGILIHGFTVDGNTFGSVRCFKAVIEDEIGGAVLKVERTDYPPTVMEVIAPVCLREALNLKDGSTVRVEVQVASW